MTLELQHNGRPVRMGFDPKRLNIVDGTNATVTVKLVPNDQRIDLQVESTGGGGSGDLLASNNLSDVADVATSRTNLGLSIGTNVQAYDADLAALAGLTSAADKGIQFTGSGTAATYDLTAAGKALLDDAAASNQRTTLGLGPASIFTYSGTSFPGSPVAGELFVRTDLDYELFYYDTGRTKWLSARTFELAFTNQTTVSAGANLRLYQSPVGSGTIAYLVKWDCVLVEIVSHRVTSGANSNVYLRDGVTNLKTHTIGSASTSATETGLNIAITAGMLLNAYANDAFTGGGHVLYTFRRTAS